MLDFVWPVALFFGLSILGRVRQKRADDPRIAVRRVINRTRRELKSVAVADGSQVSEVVTNSVRRTLIALIATDPQGLAKDGLRRALESNNIPSDLSSEILDIWEQAELFRYGGGSDPADLKQRALTLIDELTRSQK